jgi:hypothetical protein
MKLFGRGHPAAGPKASPELDSRLRQIFDDRRTPGAPDSLYTYLREVAMDSTPVPSSGRLRLAWSGLGQTGRAVAAIALVAVVGMGLFAVTVGAPRGIGVGGNPSGTPAAIPTWPAAPAGWTEQQGFAGAGPAGLVSTNITEPAPRIAIHVFCDGPDDLVVFASTDPNFGVALDGSSAQAALFHCEMGGYEGRMELTAPTGAFVSLAAVVIRSPSSLVDTSFAVGIEVPAQTPEPAGSSRPQPLPSVSAS